MPTARWALLLSMGLGVQCSASISTGLAATNALPHIHLTCPAALLLLLCHPSMSVHAFPMHPCRYAIMRDYMPTRGSLGRDMMFRSCTVQVNLDFESEEDMVQKTRIGMALQVGAGLCCCGSRLFILSGVRGRGMCRRCVSAWRCRWAGLTHFKLPCVEQLLCRDMQCCEWPETAC